MTISPLPSSEPPPVQSSPDPTPRALAFTVLRSVLLILSTLGVGWATHFLATDQSGAALNIVAGAVVDLVSALGIIAVPIWSWLDQHWMQAKAHRGAELSATRGRAVMPAR
jgi:hypothetical protein